MPDTAPSGTPLEEDADAARKSVDAGIADESAAYDVADDARETKEGAVNPASDSTSHQTA